MHEQLLQEVKNEIVRLQQVVDLLEEGGISTSKQWKRPVSAETRARISAAQKKRWSKTKNEDRGLKNGWPKTKEGRKAEAKRRKMIAKLKKQASNRKSNQKNYPLGGVA